MIMATAAVIGLSTGKRLLLGSTFYYSDLAEKLACTTDPLYQIASTKNAITAKKSSSSFVSNRRRPQSIRALKEHVADTASNPACTTLEPWLIHGSTLFSDETSDPEYLVDAVLLLQKSMLEKQWNLSAETTTKTFIPKERVPKKILVTCSGTSARCRRIGSRRKVKNSNSQVNTSKQWKSIISPELLQNSLKGYVKGVVSEQLLTHAEVVQLSQKIKAGLLLEERRSRYSNSFPLPLKYYT